MRTARTLSVTPDGVPAPPKGELWISAGQRKKLPLSGELANAVSLRRDPPRGCFRRKQARQLPFPAASPPVKRQFRKIRRFSGIAKF